MSKPKMHSPLAEQESQAVVQAPSLIDEVANWLMTQALEETDFESDPQIAVMDAAGKERHDLLQ